jgi:hypothetical protein
MPTSMTASFTFGGVPHEDVLFTWDMDHPPSRRAAPGFGFSIELPAVLLMLDPVERGTTSAGEAKATLLEVLEKAFSPTTGAAPTAKTRWNRTRPR